MSTFAGFLAGMFGIGGGIVIGPLMLEMGMVPEVAAATSAFMILFTTSVTMAEYVLLGTVVLRMVGFVFILGFGSTWIGTVVVVHVMARKKSSFLVLSMLMIVATSTVLLGLQSVDTVFDKTGRSKMISDHLDSWCS